jgi:hypothetical protein
MNNLSINFDDADMISAEQNYKLLIATSLDRIADSLMELSKSVTENPSNPVSVSDVFSDLASAISTEVSNLRGEFDEDDDEV